MHLDCTWLGWGAKQETHAAQQAVRLKCPWCAGGNAEPESPALASPFSGHVGVKALPADTAASSSVSYCGATLVVCPLVAVIQWRQEIARFTAAGTVKVFLVHHSFAGLALLHPDSGQ